ncbi:pre-B lymphocyte protein 3 isoform X1 [Apus apus]|uniref:pre-B lymphocyte protein 3 isoform X1 n=1 Tax=Apus apus TaxID=8895 RepID=UPI0021F8A64E|nr:pre-B lymphocyte protein 3 isoform X1 [Apus apus]
MVCAGLGGEAVAENHQEHLQQVVLSLDPSWAECWHCWSCGASACLLKQEAAACAWLWCCVWFVKVSHEDEDTALKVHQLLVVGCRQGRRYKSGHPESRNPVDVARDQQRAETCLLSQPAKGTLSMAQPPVHPVAKGLKQKNWV